MPRREGYYRDYYAQNKEKYKKYYYPTYAYEISINGINYIFDKKQDIKIKRVKYSNITDTPDYVFVSSYKQK